MSNDFFFFLGGEVVEVVVVVVVALPLLIYLVLIGRTGSAMLNERCATHRGNTHGRWYLHTHRHAVRRQVDGETDRRADGEHEMPQRKELSEVSEKVDR